MRCGRGSSARWCRRRPQRTVTLEAAVKWPAMSSVSTYWGSRANTQPTAVSPSTGNLQSPRTVEDGRLSWRFPTQPARGANPLRHNVGADARRLPVPRKQVPHDGAELAAAAPPLRGLTTLGPTADPSG